MRQSQVNCEHCSVCVLIKCLASYHPLLCDCSGDGVKTCHITAIGLDATRFNPIPTTVTEKQAIVHKALYQMWTKYCGCHTWCNQHQLATNAMNSICT